MKVFLDASLLSVGGGVQVGLGIIHHIIRDPDFEVTLVCSAQVASQLSVHERALVHEFHVVSSGKAIGKLKAGLFLARIERRVNPNIVFTVFGPSYWRSRTVNLQGFALGKMLYADSRANYGSWLQRFIEEATDFFKILLLKRNVDFFVVETGVVRERLAGLLNISRDRIFVVPNSFSPAFEARCVELRNLTRPRSKRFSIFVPASFYHHKNLEIIPAVARYLSDKAEVEIEFVFTLDEGSVGWQRIWQRGVDLSVAHMLRAAGVVPNSAMADLYWAADAVLCTSLVESSTAVFPEAFMAGRPLLVSDRDFARDLCGAAALYFDPLAVASIGDRILELIGSPALAADLVEKGRSQLEQNYPTPLEKWRMQKDLLVKLAHRGRPVEL